VPPKPGRHWFNPSIAHIEGPELLVSSGSGPYFVRRMTLNKRCSAGAGWFARSSW